MRLKSWLPRWIYLINLVLLLGVLSACATFGEENAGEPVQMTEPADAAADDLPEPSELAPSASPFPIIPTAGGGPPDASPTPVAVSLDLNTIYAEVIESLPVGSALFNPAEEMRQGQVYEVEVRVAPVTEKEIEADEEIQATLTADLEDGSPVIVIPVRVSTVMRAQLTGAGFTIEALTEEEQIRDSSRPFLRWMWQVRPEERGEQRLTLHLSVVVNAEGMGDRTHTISEVREVAVKGNPVYSARTFLGSNWEWVATGLVLPAVGWIWRRFRARRGLPD